jgi:hypothetical protein
MMGTIYEPSFILASLLNGPIGAVQDQRCPDGSIVGWAGSATDTPTEWATISAKEQTTGAYSIKGPRWTVAELYFMAEVGLGEIQCLTRSSKRIAFRKELEKCRHAKTCQACQAGFHSWDRVVRGFCSARMSQEQDPFRGLHYCRHHSGIFTEWANRRCSGSKMP